MNLNWRALKLWCDKGSPTDLPTPKPHPRGVGKNLEARGVRNFDGARHAHSPEVPELFVWTSALGRKVLEDRGFLSDQVGNVYH